MNKRTLLLTVTLPWAACSAGPAIAQTAGAASEAAGATASANADKSTQAPASASGLGEIIVTAQRRSETLQRAAVAVDVVNGKDLIAAGLTQPGRLGELVPALTVEAAGGGNIFFIRGVGNFSVAAYSDPAIAFNYDGIYVSRPTSTSGTFYDLDRIEVLKGPQGTLYGRNATGGAINVLPTLPKLGKFEGFISATGGNYGTGTMQGAVNVPVGDKSAFRFSGALSYHDGYLRDGSDDDATSAFRGQFKSEVTPRLTIRLSTDIEHVGGVGAGQSYVENSVYNRATGQFTVTPAPTDLAEGIYSADSNAFRQTISAGTAGRTLGPIAEPAYPPEYRNNKFYGANAQIDYDLGFAKLTILPAWRKSSVSQIVDGTAFPVYLHERDRQYSVEARLAGNLFGSVLDYQLGGLFFDEKNEAHYSVNQQYAMIFQDFTPKTRSYAGFGRLTAHLTDRLRVVGGVRYTSDHKSFDGTSDALALVCVSPVGCPTAPLFNLTNSIAEQPIVPKTGGVLPAGRSGAIVARQTFGVDAGLVDNKVTYRGAVEYDLRQNSLLYASVETGYRSGGFSLAVGYPSYQPETITAYTIGLKNRFLDNRLQLNLEGFYWRYKNQQLLHTGVDLAGNNVNFTQNIGKSDLFGGEIEGRFLLTPRTIVSTDTQYLHTREHDYVYNVPTGSAPPRVGCPITPGTTAYLVNCSGQPAYNSPKWTINIGGEQTLPLGAYKVVLGVDSQYKSSFYSGFDYLPSELVRARWLTSAQVAFSPQNDRWSIAAFVRNIENNRLLTYSVSANNGTLISGYVSDPRTYGARLTFKF